MATTKYLDSTGLQYIVQHKLPGKVDQGSDGSGVILNGKSGTYTNSATGNYSLATGSSTTASGNSSTATGYHTTASGYYSTAMGYQSTASGDYSTAMGNNTTASGATSLVIGCYNEDDPRTSSVPWNSNYKGNYSLIIGNGKSSSALSNALTVDWSGNVVCAGKLTASTVDASSITVDGQSLESYIQTIVAAIATADIDSTFGDTTTTTSSVGEGEIVTESTDGESEAETE